MIHSPIAPTASGIKQHENQICKEITSFRQNSVGSEGEKYVDVKVWKIWI